MGVSFVSLETQYTSFHENEKVFLVSTPSGPQFFSRNFFIRIFDTLFLGYSYDITTSSLSLLQSAHNLIISPALATEPELSSAIKLMKIAQGILIHARAPSQSQTQLQHTLCLFAKTLATKQQRSTIEVLFEFHCRNELFATLKNDPLPESSPSEVFEPILQYACEQNETEAALALIQHNVSTKNLHNIEPAYIALLAHEAHERGYDTALSLLVYEQETIWTNEELYFAAVRKGLFSSIKRFIEKKKILPDLADTEKNTALHYAFIRGDLPLVQFLLPHCNPLAKNTRSETPLQALLSAAERGYILPPKAFLESFFSRPPDEFQGTFLENLNRIVDPSVPSSTRCESVELCFLLQKPPACLASQVPREDFDAAIPYLRKKYPQANIDAFFLSSFTLNLVHLKTGCDRPPLSTKVPNNTSLEKLYVFFDDLPWKSIDIEKFYEQVFERSFSTGDRKSELRQALEKFVKRIQGQESFSGTPTAQPALHDFFSQIELALRHCASTLEQAQDQPSKQAFLVEILRAANHCGGRYFQTATSQYLRICHGLEELPRGIFERLLALYRQICFEGVVGDLYDGHANAFTQATLDLGKELGIPGAENTFDDPFKDLNYDRSEIRKLFFETAYTPYSIIFFHLIPTLTQDTEARNAYVDLQKEALPSSWKQEHYKAIQEELTALSHLKEQERKREEDCLLAKHQIYRYVPDQPATEAIEEARRIDFLWSFVYDIDKKPTLQGIIFLLERLEVLSSLFTWKDPSRNAAPLPQLPAYRKIPILGPALDGIGSFFKSLLSYWH